MAGRTATFADTDAGSSRAAAALRALGVGRGGRVVFVYGASPIPLPVLREAVEVIGCSFVQSYGLTESTGGFTLLGPADHVPDEAYPAEVESVLTGHPSVAEVAVVGVPSARLALWVGPLAGLGLLHVAVEEADDSVDGLLLDLVRASSAVGRRREDVSVQRVVPRHPLGFLAAFPQ
jgi:acyl-coenzyme A synthetase/AMP-(fatty) acid ligase